MNKCAFITGISNYTHAPLLKNAVNDAKVVNTILLQLGFKTCFIEDATESEFIETFETFCSQNNNSTLVLFYFAGHAFQHKEKNYLLPSDSVNRRSIKLDWIIDMYQENFSNAYHIFLLDCCRSVLENVTTHGLSELCISKEKNPKGSLIVFSAEPNCMARSSSYIDEHHSPFTTALYENLNHEEKELKSLMKNICKRVPEITNNEQRPWYTSTIEDEVYLGNKFTKKEEPNLEITIEEKTDEKLTKFKKEDSNIPSKSYKKSIMNPRKTIKAERSKRKKRTFFTQKKITNNSYQEKLLSPSDENEFKRLHRLLILKNYKECISEATKLIERQQCIVAYCIRALALLELHQLFLARREIDFIFFLEPMCPMALATRAIFQFFTGKEDKALEDVNRALHLDPKLAFAYNQRCIIFFKLGKISLALQDANHAILLDKTNPCSYNNRGVCNTILKKYHEAIKDFTSAINIEPNFAWAYNRRGWAYHYLGEINKAIEDFKKYKELDPDLKLPEPVYDGITSNARDRKSVV